MVVPLALCGMLHESRKATNHFFVVGELHQILAILDEN
jgi:hypothetical protein